MQDKKEEHSSMIIKKHCIKLVVEGLFSCKDVNTERVIIASQSYLADSAELFLLVAIHC